MVATKIINRTHESFDVKAVTFSSYAFIVFVLLGGAVSYVKGVQMTTLLIPSENSAKGDLVGVRFIDLKYDPGSTISKQLAGKTENVRFTLNSSDPAMARIVSIINSDIASQKKSPVRFTNASLVYTGQIRGDADSATLSYKVNIKPTISNFVLDKSNQGTVVDLDWRGFVIDEPLVVNVPKYGNMSINYPIGLLQATHPDLAKKFLASASSSAMKTPLLDFQDVAKSMDSWHFLFDPTGSQAGAAGFKEVGGARAVSIYSLGESSFREGTMTEKVSDTTANINGSPVGVHASIPPPSAQIQITGFSNIRKSGNSELAFVSDKAPEGTVTATGGFPIQVLLVLGGMMGAVAVFVLLKARK